LCCGCSCSRCHSFVTGKGRHAGCFLHQDKQRAAKWQVLVTLLHQQLGHPPAQSKEAQNMRQYCCVLLDRAHAPRVLVLPVDGGLICLNVGQYGTRLHFLALLDQPLAEIASSHCRTECRHAQHLYVRAELGAWSVLAVLFSAYLLDEQAGPRMSGAATCCSIQTPCATPCTVMKAPAMMEVA
jgi:hypothetical protein